MRKLNTATEAMTTPTYKDERFVAKYFDVSVECVRGWRKRKVGPPFAKICGHLIRYEVGNLSSWAASQRGGI
jgi:hypothetical protein